VATLRYDDQDSEQTHAPVHLRVPAHSRSLRLLRLVASSLAADLGFPLDELDEVRIVVDELGSALIADADPGDALEVDLWTGDRALHVRASAPRGGEHALTIDPIARELLVILSDEFEVSSPDGRHVIELSRAMRSGPP